MEEDYWFGACPACSPLPPADRACRPRHGGLLRPLGAARSLGALAQDASDKAAPLKLQLNKLETAGEACRITMVIDNAKGPV